MSPTDALYDPGLQAERTLLAWRRTCLAFAGVSLLAMRFTLHALGGLAVAMGAAGATFAIIAYCMSAAGYRRTHTHLHRTNSLQRSGWPILFAAAAPLSVGGLCLLYLAHVH